MSLNLKHLPLRRLSVRRAGGILMWVLLLFAIAPLGFNCHSQSDLAPFSQNSEPQDSEDQTVRAMDNQSAQQLGGYAAIERGFLEKDGAVKGELKIRLGEASLLSAADATASGLQAKLRSQNDTIIKKGTKLSLLYDNDCRQKRSVPLHFEAEARIVEDDASMSALAAQFNSDPCLVRVDENETFQLIDPLPENISHLYKTTDQTVGTQTVGIQATVNDSRVSEAKHISFSKALLSWDWFFSDAAINSAQLPNDVIVAVVDTGIQYTHPDLAENIYKSATGSNGYDFVNNDNDPMDDQGHGTHVAGIIGARANNGIGVTGVMGQNVKLMGVKVLNAQGSGDLTTIANGIRYAADNGAQVLNMSLGGKGQSTQLRDAMSYAVSKGVVIVVAAGNDGVLINSSNNFYSPAGYAKDVAGAIAVGSVDAVAGTRSSFSNYSTAYVWIAAPGSNGILSTYPTNTYTALQGTSMASPVVAGAAALIVGAYRSRGIAYSPADVINILTESARSDSGLTSFFRNGASLDIDRAAKLFFSRHVLAGTAGMEDF